MRREIKRCYDRIGEVYVQKRQVDGDVELLAELVERADADTPVLDAGCGAGFPVLTTLAEHFTVFGIDISPAQLRLARQRVPSAHLVCQDVTRLPFPDETFGAISMYYVLFNVPRTDHREVLSGFTSNRLLEATDLPTDAVGTSP